MSARTYSVCVFCSAQSGLDPRIFDAAAAFAKGLASRRWALVYGGGAAGLMGHFADHQLAAGGSVIGVIPNCLHDRVEIAHRGLTRLEVVPDMFERKRVMMRESDAFVIFPGGWGTLDEALEVLTWKVLGEIDKPILFVNLDGFWDSQMNVFEDMIKRGVLKREAMSLFEVVADTNACLARLEQLSLA